MKALVRSMLLLGFLGLLPSCVWPFAKRAKVPMNSPARKEPEGYIATLKVGERLHGIFNRDPGDYRLVEIENGQAGFRISQSGDGKILKLHTGDTIPLATRHQGRVTARIKAIGSEEVAVFIPERTFIVEPGPKGPAPVDCPLATAVQEHPGFVTSPYTGKTIDATDIDPGDLAVDPTTPPGQGKKIFRVPADLWKSKAPIHDPQGQPQEG